MKTKKNIFLKHQHPFWQDGRTSFIPNPKFPFNIKGLIKSVNYNAFKAEKTDGWYYDSSNRKLLIKVNNYITHQSNSVLSHIICFTNQKTL